MLAAAWVGGAVNEQQLGAQQANGVGAVFHSRLRVVGEAWRKFAASFGCRAAIGCHCRLLRHAAVRFAHARETIALEARALDIEPRSAQTRDGRSSRSPRPARPQESTCSASPTATIAGMPASPRARNGRVRSCAAARHHPERRDTRAVEIDRSDGVNSSAAASTASSGNVLRGDVRVTERAQHALRCRADRQRVRRATRLRHCSGCLSVPELLRAMRSLCALAEADQIARASSSVGSSSSTRCTLRKCPLRPTAPRCDASRTVVPRSASTVAIALSSRRFPRRTCRSPVPADRGPRRPSAPACRPRRPADEDARERAPARALRRRRVPLRRRRTRCAASLRLRRAPRARQFVVSDCVDCGFGLAGRRRAVRRVAPRPRRAQADQPSFWRSPPVSFITHFDARIERTRPSQAWRQPCMQAVLGVDHNSVICARASRSRRSRH